MVDHAGHVYLPGELICNLKESEKTSKILVGPGLRQDEESIIVTKCGLLRFKEPNFYWIDSHLKRVHAYQREITLILKKQKKQREMIKIYQVLLLSKFTSIIKLEKCEGFRFFNFKVLGKIDR